MQRYLWLHAVQGDLLEKLGRRNEARLAFCQAAALSENQREQQLLARRTEGAV